MPPISRLLRANQQQSAQLLVPCSDEKGSCELAALEPNGVWVTKLREQSQNVYENKGSAGKSTTPSPSLSKVGNSLPSSDEEGWGWCEVATLSSNQVQVTKLREQSQNVYENKGSARKSTTPNPSLSKEGNSWRKNKKPSLHVSPPLRCGYSLLHTSENLPRVNNVCGTLRNCGKQLASGGGTAFL